VTTVTRTTTELQDIQASSLLWRECVGVERVCECVERVRDCVDRERVRMRVRQVC